MTQNQTLLKFSSMKNNAKLQRLGLNGYTLDLPAGYSCPGAERCKSQAVGKDGKWSIKDGAKTEFRCFAATSEVIFRAVRENRWHNFELLKACKGSVNKIHDLLVKSLPDGAGLVRFHVSGDWFHRSYLEAALELAKDRPWITFYSYTKSLPHWIALKDKIPSNFKLNASRGGHYDDLIDKHSLKSALVVFSEQEAFDKGLEIDHDDSHAFLQDKSFALLLHSTQPKGTPAAEALRLLAGKGSYSHKNKKNAKTTRV